MPVTDQPVIDPAEASGDFTLETPAKKFTKPTGPKVCHQIV